MEIVTLKRSLALNVQEKRSTVDYLEAFKANMDAINLSGRYAVGSIATAKLVAKEQGLNCDVAKPVKQESIMQDAAKPGGTGVYWTQQQEAKESQGRHEA